MDSAIFHPSAGTNIPVRMIPLPKTQSAHSALARALPSWLAYPCYTCEKSDSNGHT